MSEVTGSVRRVLRAEGLAILALSVYIYSLHGFSWLVFAVLFLVPDLSFLGYLLNSKYGAIVYNAAHSLIGALIVCAVGIYLKANVLQMIGLIWVAHVGFDRALGYGLKYSARFGHTHLGRIGKIKNTE